MPGFELIGKEEQEALNQVFEDGGIFFAHGFDKMRNGRFRVREFEKAFADYMGVKYAQAVNTGTAAVKVALKAAGVGPGDEVITQAFTFVATAEAIIEVGAKPVIVNIDDTLNMSPEEFEKAITPKTRAVVPVHMLGVAAEIDQIVKIAKANGIIVVDDNCESIGAEWGNQKLGVQSDVCAWSFDFGKTITTGEGGMVTTNNEEFFNLAREYHDHGHMNNPDFPRGKDTHRIHGFNYRMTELQAAVGLVQLNKLDYIVQKNREHYSVFEEALAGVDGVNLRSIPKACKPLCDCLIINFDSKEKADAYVRLLGDHGLGTKNVPDAIEWHFAKYWDHMFECFDRTADEFMEDIKGSNAILERSVALPVMVNMKEDEVKRRAELMAELAAGI